MQEGDFQDFERFNRIVLRVWKTDSDGLMAAYLYDSGRIEVLNYGDRISPSRIFTTSKII
jgi:hypothetical protein